MCAHLTFNALIGVEKLDAQMQQVKTNKFNIDIVIVLITNELLI